MAGPGLPIDPWGTGYARLGSWTIVGQGGPHTMALVSGMLGSGKIQAWVDGQQVLTIDKPKSLNPSVMSAPGTVDGRMVQIYAESPDDGITVRCDVFVDGVSLSTGEPVVAAFGRAATVDHALAQRRTVDNQRLLMEVTAGILGGIVFLVAAAALGVGLFWLFVLLVGVVAAPVILSLSRHW